MCEPVSGRCVVADGGADDSGDADPGSALPDVQPDTALPLTVSLRSPSGTVYTNGTVAFDLTLGGPMTEMVELLRGDQVLATLMAPYQFAWDTRAVPEGSYQVTARATAGQQIVMTEPVTVVVDRTPPQAQTRVPIPDAVGISLFEDPIQITFSEPLRPSSITESAVVISTGAMTVPSKKTLSVDGKVLVVELTSPTKVPLPATVSAATAATITDLAGNPLALMSWSWTYPAWLQLGSPIKGRNARIVVGDDARPVVAAAILASGANWIPQVSKHLRGTEWTQLGSPPGATRGGTELSVAVDKSRNPVIVWPESDGVADQARVARWTGTGWDTVYGMIDAVGGRTSVGTTTVQVDSMNRPIIAWYEPQDEASSSYAIHVARWVGANGMTWDTSAGVAALGRHPTMVLGLMDAPIIAFDNGETHLYGLSRLTKTPNTWEETSNPVVRESSVLVVDSKGVPVVAFADQAGKLFVQGLVGGIWKDYVPAFETMEHTLFDEVQIGLDSGDRPVLAWTALFGGASKRIMISIIRWNGSAWEQGPRIDDSKGSSTVLVVDKFGRPAVAWTQGQPEQINVWLGNK